MKRFNYTGRKKILQEDVKVRLQGDFDDMPVVDVAVSLSGYGFPLDCAVFLEPQRKTRFMRIELGKAESHLRRNGIKLTEFDDAVDVSFRVKVVDAGRGLLLGIAENIKPYSKDDRIDEHQKSILPVTSVDLSAYGVLWRVEQDDQKAVLQIERNLGGRDQVVRSLMFRAFIWPAAMRQILAKILNEDSDWDEDLSDPEDLSTKWLLFARQIGAGLPEKSGDIDDWIDKTVRILTERIGARREAIEFAADGGWK